ncbi:MAG: hypothetical protein EOO04_19405 [Chitinophagaceae bacterium]|nr:MAG: hypothetical protein EOO04_19405 [Chitinophagaceae bacterium]
MKQVLILMGISIVITLSACSSDSEDLLEPTTPNPANPTCDTTAVTFSATITPLLTSYGCTGCHSGTAPSGNFVLTSYNAVKAKINDGRLFGAINHQAGFRPMPQGGNKMAACDINKIKAWIDRGALNN